MAATGDLAGPDRAALEAHVRECRGCASALAASARLVRRLRRLRGPGPDEAFLAGLRLAGRKAIGRARRRQALGRATALAAALAAGLVAGAVVWQTWPAPRGLVTAERGVTGLRHGGAASAPASAAMVREVWRHRAAPSAPVSLRNAVVVRGETLYAPTADGGPSHVVAMDARTGEVRWRSDVAGRGYLAADDGGVYFLASGPAGLTELVALDPRTGAVRWRYGPSEAGRSPAGRSAARSPSRAAAIEGGRVAWTSGSAVHLLDASDGRPIWVRPLAGEGLVSAPAADGEGLLVASAGAVYRLARETGEVLWRRPLGGASGPLARPRPGEARLSAGVQARPLVEAGGGRVFVTVRQTGNRDRLVALDPAREAELWALDLPPVFHLLARDGRLYVRGEGVLALDAPSGRRLWTHQAQGCGPTTVAEGIVYFVDTADRGRLVAAGADDGRDVWQVPGLQSCEPMVLAGGMGFLKSSDGVLRAMALAGPR